VTVGRRDDLRGHLQAQLRGRETGPVRARGASPTTRRRIGRRATETIAAPEAPFVLAALGLTPPIADNANVPRGRGDLLRVTEITRRIAPAAPQHHAAGPRGGSAISGVVVRSRMLVEEPVERALLL